MNILNEKARILRVQIAVERNRQNPNWKTIQKLENELKKCIEGLNEGPDIM